MINIKEKRNCSGCEACLNICPKKCIKMVQDEEGFRYPQVDMRKCINCGLCEKICPILRKRDNENKNLFKAKVYGMTNKNKDVLLQSSSGGVFFELARYIIEQKNGVVFGARYDIEKNVVFDYAEDINKAKCFCGSKYIQANNENMFKKAKNFLDAGRVVLFSGTPCQVAGLKSFLLKDYANLYTCDFVCAGVPSELVFNSLKEAYEKKYHSKITNITFRNKKYGWAYSSFMTLYFENGKKKDILQSDSDYSVLFSSLTIMRPSCYECKFRELNSHSDIKMSDFWNVKDAKQGVYDFNGVSQVVVATDKGNELFSHIRDNFNVFNSSIEEMKKCSPLFNTKKHSIHNRDLFFDKIKGKNNVEIYSIMNNYLHKHTYLTSILYKMKLELVKLKYKIIR